MDRTIKAGLLRETKNPPDRRVPLSPRQIIALGELYPNVKFFVQPSDLRCYADKEYEYLGIPLKEDLRDCDILLGVKEVDHRVVIPGKTYLFFAHVGKKQPHNREMFVEMAGKGITLIDYEYLTTGNNQRVVAFGRWAGIVGAYNALRASGIRTNNYRLKPAYQCRDLEEVWAGLRRINIDRRLKILATGGGRVACGILETLNVCNILQVEPEDFLTREFDIPVVCRIGPEHYTRHSSRQQFSFSHFVSSPDEYITAFLPFTKVTDILITGHYWDPRSPRFFSKEEMKQRDFRISVIADISCDVDGAVPSTIRATTISDPFYGYNPELDAEEPPFANPANITVMAIDNLPGELPRDSSDDFGKQLMKSVLNDLFTGNESRLLERATILKNGILTEPFKYLDDYLNT